MVQYNPLSALPTAAELPCSDDTPVDNELQNSIPNLLLAILALIWPDRNDWFFGVDMGIYYLPDQRPQTPLVPDGFLSLQVERRKGERGRLSYVLWEENNTPPILVLEFVSQTYGGEYDSKMAKYVRLGALYYVIYNPEYHQRDNHAPFEVYRLRGDRYELLPGDPVWLPEIGLGIGRASGTHENWTREWLYWFNEAGDRYPAPEDVIAQEQRRVEQERRRAEQAEQDFQQERLLREQERSLREALLQKLRDRGIDPAQL